jgi:hypothetical protein
MQVSQFDPQSAGTVGESEAIAGDPSIAVSSSRHAHSPNPIFVSTSNAITRTRPRQETIVETRARLAALFSKMIFFERLLSKTEAA